MTSPAVSPDLPRVRLRFDRFELDEADARLTCDNVPVALAPKPFDVLCTLVRKPQMLVTKNALLDAVWGHRFVTDSVLKSAISEVRAALQDDSRQPRYIETVSRRGYRFMAAAVPLPAHPGADDVRSSGAFAMEPALAALTALCRCDSALAAVIRKVAMTLERERLIPQPSH